MKAIAAEKSSLGENSGERAVPSEVLGLNLIFESPNLDNLGDIGFPTGISLRELVRTEPAQKKFFTLFISIPHLGTAQMAEAAQVAGPAQVLVGSKTLREYRFMGTATPATSSTAIAPREKVRVYQTWFLLFDNGSSPLYDKSLKILIDIDTIGIFRSADDDLANRAPLFPFQDRWGSLQALMLMLSNSITILEKPALKVLQQRASSLVLSSTAFFLNGNWLTEEHRNGSFCQAYKKSAKQTKEIQHQPQPKRKRTKQQPERK